MGWLFDNLITWSIHHRVVVLLGALVLLIAGGWYTTHAALDVLPDFSPPRVVVQTEAPGMGTSDVEELVTRPVERALLGTPEATSVRSISSPGLSVITLMFADDVDIYRARQLVTERLQLTGTHLPDVVRPPALAPISAPIGALLKFCITSASPDPKEAGRQMRRFADFTLRPRLLAIPGVAQVTAQGGDVERIEVRPDPVRMAARGIALAQLLDAVRRSQSISGAGFVESGPARIDVQYDARLSLLNVESKLAATIVQTRSGLPVRVMDIADVVRGDEPPVGAAVYDGRAAVYVQVNKLPWADTLAVTRRVESALHELESGLPPGAAMQPPVFRQASFVETSIRGVGRSMLIGSFLVVAVLFVFLRSGRLAAISLTAIPLSILAAATVLVAHGASINGMTLGGLAIAVGEVVDDAIVDVENVWRRLRENAQLERPRPALDVIHDASREVRGSVVYATLIVVLVLVPVMLLSGIAGRIFSPLAQAYMLAILASLAVALTVTPAMCAWLLPRAATAEARPTRLALWMVDRYARVLRSAIRRPRLVLLAAGIAGLGALVVVPFLGGRFLPEFHERSLIAHVHAVPGTSLDEAVRLATAVESQAGDVSEHVAARVGRAELDEDAAPVNRIEMDFVLKPQEGREWDELVIDVATRIGRVPGLGFVVEGFLGERIHEVLSGETAPVVVKVIGPDLQELRALAASVARIIERTPGLGAARIEPQIDVAEIRIRPDADALARYGVQPAELALAVTAYRQGIVTTQILEHDGLVVDVAVAGSVASRSQEALRALPIDTPLRGRVDLGTLAAIERVPEPALVNHDGGERRITIGAGASGAGLSGAVAKLEERLKREVRLPKGYRLEVGGEAVARSEAATRLMLTGGAVLVGIFVLLATVFASIRDAAVVLLNFPLGLVGGVIAAALTPEGLSVAGFVGFITLFGIIARNGIMLVSHKRHLDEAHAEIDPVERVLRAAEERLLPILMTAATAGLGLLPLALSFESAGSEIEAPMALIVCGGLVTSTTLNMVVLPTVYVWLERRRGRREANR